MTELIPTLIIAAVAVILVVTTIAFLVSRYRRCASDEILVVFGSSGKKTKVDMPDGSQKEVTMPSKVIHGGGTFVWPIIQDFRKMSLAPLQIQETIDGRSKENIPVHIPITLTTSIGTTQELMNNAATRMLSVSRHDQIDLLKDVMIGEVRNLIANLTVVELKENRDKFLGAAKEQIEPELNKLGFEITNLNSADVKDDAKILDSLSQKASSQALATANADIAEQDKIGKIKVANTKKEEAIALAQATKERETTVAQTTQEQEVQVANVNKEKAIKLANTQKEQAVTLAETEKERQTSIANLEAEQQAAVANAEATKIAKVAEAQALADSKEAEQEALAAANIAKSQAQAAASKAEAEAAKQTRMAQALAKQESDTQKAVQEKEAAVAEFESNKRQKAAEAAKKAGVAEQQATIEVSKAKGEAAKAAAEADRVAGTSKVEATMAVEKARQERQLEVNQAEAKAQEAKLLASVIIPAQKAKEEATIKAEAEKSIAVIAANAEAEAEIKKAEARARAIQMVAEAEAEGNRKKLLAEAEGKKAALMAEAEAAIQKAEGLSKAEVAGMREMVDLTQDPQAVLDYYMKDVKKEIGVAEAYSRTLEHTISGQVAVYGDAKTASDFAGNLLALVPRVKALGQAVSEGVDTAKEIWNGEQPKQLENDSADFETVE